jgi:predicted ATPase/DNA-binding SARP family transcriptional activator
VLAISVLGPVELRSDGRRLVVPAGRTTELLIRLALDAGVTVGVDRLIEDIWGFEANATRRNTVQTKISKLRRVLGDAAMVLGSHSGYSLEVDPSAVDATEVLRVAGAARELLDAGNARSASQVCGRALALFRGDRVLSDAGDGAWVVPYRLRLEEVHLGLIEDELAARMELGAGQEVIGELQGLVVLHPLRERLWELLVTALYRAGRQADALSTYQRVKSRLLEDLGLDPGPGLRRLEQQILVQEVTLGVPSAPVGSFVPDTRTGNLPSMSAELVGREAEVATLSGLLAGERLVEIVGPGGVGKTAVAIALGRRLSVPDGVGSGGVWLARLETATTAHDVVDTLIAAMTVVGGEAALFERLRSSAALVILDNCEHVLDAAATLAVRLLDAAPGLRILCTSQVRLEVEGEAVFELAPLALADAVELFRRRATRQRLAEGDDAVLGLCRSLDGLPLVIELAAARTRTLSIEEIARRLDDRFAVLVDPTSRRPDRRRSLRSTIRWSYELLFPDDQRGLWALATFAGGACLPAVEFVLDTLEVPAAAAIDVIGRLTSRSLVIVDDGPAKPAGAQPERVLPPPIRYRLLDSIRAFALDMVTEAGLSGRAHAAHAAWFADQATSSLAGVRSGRQAEFLAFVRSERANIDAALAWSASHDPALGLRIAGGFGWAWVVLGDSRGAHRILGALDAAGDLGQDRERGSALLLAAWIEASTGHLELARDHIATVTALAASRNDVDLEARCLYYLAYVVSHHGEFRQAMELTDRSRVLYDGLDRPWDQAANGLFAARAAISAGDRERSIAAATQVRHWLQKVEDPWLHVRGDAMLGELARLQHRFDEAVQHLGRAADASRRLGFLQTEAYQVAILGRAQCQAGDYDAGAATLELAVDKAESTGDPRLAALTRVHLGRVLRAMGQPSRARMALEAAAAWHRDAGGGELATLGDCLLTAMDVVEGTAAVRERLARYLDDARRQGDAQVEVFALDALAHLAAKTGDITGALQRCDAADRRMEAASHFITDLDRTDAHSARSIIAAASRG